MTTQVDIPEPLLNAIRDGNCVAFVGSGFSAAARYPSWRDLLCQMAKDLWQDDGVDGNETLSKILAERNPNSRELEMAAQIIFDKAELSEPGGHRFQTLLKAQFDQKKVLPEAMVTRLEHLLGIPFRAIVTTNFDPLLEGRLPSPETYHQLLRPESKDVWTEGSVNASLYRLGSGATSCQNGKTLIVQLHGSINQQDSKSLVFTRSQYRSRLYANPAYLTALRALLATSPVLFLGYSLTDAYLNELRAELVEAFALGGRTGEPLAWAVLEDVSDISKEYFLKHEGLGVISFNSKKGTPFSEFDRVLQNLNELTNPIHRLKKAIDSKRILWFDPEPANNEIAVDLLRRASQSVKDQLVQVKTLGEARNLLGGNDQGFDLVISHWGHDKLTGTPKAMELLLSVAQWRAEKKVLPPVIVFAKHQEKFSERTIKNRRMALTSGAVAYVTEWKPLMKAIEELLGDSAMRI